MVANRQSPRPGTVTDLINRLLDNGYNQIAQPVIDAIASSVNAGLIQRRLADLDAEAQRLDELGERLTPDNPVLRALLADLETTLRRDAARINDASEPLQAAASTAAATIQRQLALPGMTNAQLRAIGIRWNVPDPERVARLVTYAQSPAWAAQLRQYGPDVLAIVNNQAIRGSVAGWGSLRTAREVRSMTESIPAHQANNLMRTLNLTSYRDSAAIHQQANLAIAQQVIRIAALDLRTCLSCVAQHGMVIWDSSRDVNAPVPRVNDHHSGRCTSIIVVTGRAVNIIPGPQWFASLSPERQAQQTSFASSPGKLEAYRSGQVQLADFIHRYDDPTFGPMLREASLAGALAHAE